MSNPTQFRAELWTIVHGPASPKEGTEKWAVIMLDGDEAGFPCAFGSKQQMTTYARDLNLSERPAKEAVSA